MGFLPRVSAVPLSPSAGLMLRSAQLTLAFDHQSTGDGRHHPRSRRDCSQQRGTDRRRQMPIREEDLAMTNRIRRKPATRMAARIAAALAIILGAMLVPQQLSETNAVTPDALQPIQFGYLHYSGGDIWHAFPTRR